jgi:hypothetical protein
MLIPLVRARANAEVTMARIHSKAHVLAAARQ